MEKYSQFRDRGSGIAPFLPITSPPSGVYLPVHVVLFVFKLAFFLPLTIVYFCLLQYLPLGSLVKKAMLWTILGIPGIWWIDLQIDGVKKGSLAGNVNRVPAPKSVIASSFTSPIDSLYLAAIFDPIFTVSYPNTRQVEYISLLGSILRALSAPQEQPSSSAQLVDLSTLIAQHPDRIIVVFPECTTTNGRGILPLAPALLNVSPTTKIFPVNLRYTTPDITTPVPGAYLRFIWNLLSQPTHCIRVRIAEVVYNTSSSTPATTSTKSTTEKKDKYLANFLDTLGDDGAMTSSTDTLGSGVGADNTMTNGDLSAEERRVLDRIGEALARLGRVKRVALTVREKAGFIEAWSRRRR